MLTGRQVDSLEVDRSTADTYISNVSVILFLLRQEPFAYGRHNAVCEASDSDIDYKSAVNWASFFRDIAF